MSEEIKVEVEKTIEEIQAERIAELEEQIANAVDPDELRKAQEAYKNLLKSRVDRRQVPDDEPELRKAGEIAKEFRGIEHGDISNREYIKLALEYRKSHIAEFGTDPFTDFGVGGPSAPTEKTKRVAEGLQFLVDTYKTDSLFNAQLQEYMKDDLQLLRKLRNKK